MKELGRRLARKLNQAKGPVALFIPLKGVSALSKEGEFFHDSAADEAMFQALRAEIDRNVVELHELDTDVNDPAFAETMARRLNELYVGMES